MTTVREGGLPSQVTGFVGRRQALADVRRGLRTARLLTLTGAGGIGKTRLALAVAETSAREFPDGVWVAPLAPTRTDAAVPGATATALGLPDLGVRPALEQLTEHLAHRRALLVLDNCEHVVDACAELSRALLLACPGLRILATSRRTLDTPGETVHAVPALPPEEAAELLRVRAAESGVGHRVREAADAEVTRLCAGLDGLPLAIELAASRLDTVSVEEMTVRLADRSAGPTALPALRAAIDWSHGLCTPAERALWNRLSVFAGGFTLEAAEEVCGGDSVSRCEVVDLLDRLVSQSIVLVDDVDGTSRYRMLEALRAYGREHLNNLGERDELLRRHRAFYLTLARRTTSDWFGPGQEEALSHLRAEHANILAALERPTGPETRGERPADSGTAARRPAGPEADGVWSADCESAGRRLRSGVAVARAAGSGAAVRGSAGPEADGVWSADCESAGRRLGSGVAVAPAADSGAVQARTAGVEAATQLHPAGPEVAQAHPADPGAAQVRPVDPEAPQPLPVAPGMDPQHHSVDPEVTPAGPADPEAVPTDPAGSSGAQPHLADTPAAPTDQADPEAAQPRPADPSAQARLALAAALGFHWCCNGFVGEGRRRLDEALADAPEPTEARAAALWTAAWVAQMQGDLDTADRRLDEADALAVRLGGPLLRAYVRGERGTLALYRGRPHDAVPLFESAVAEQSASEGEQSALRWLFQLSLAHLYLGDPRSAETARRAIATAEAHGERLTRAYALWVLGYDAWLRGSPEESTALTRACLEIHQGFHDHAGVAMALEVLAWGTAALGDHPRAARLLGALRPLAWELGPTAAGQFAEPHARCETAILDALGPDAYAEALAEGGRYDTPRRAVALALGAPDTGRAPVTLTRKEREVAACVARGLTTHQICTALGRSPRTVDGHLNSVLTKLGFIRPSQIAAWWTATDQAHVPEPDA
ncbi:LuxR C-terminal-related transcriptional regulator [Streptomyces roseirectus]|uniref:LuxR C-terminal-related transcriptional regulator n=1 Tax=Streptomyces roseirectus TaxID=2768066 RepID=UPI001FEC304F|nr:LuxR C-terminal-related transcriptional regulator [Streptomyces roseirectus]